MVLGSVVLDGLVGSDNTTTTGFVSLASDPPDETNHNTTWYGSGSDLKHHRSATEDDWRSSKLSKTTTTTHDDDNTNSSSKPMLFQHRNNHSSLRSNVTLFSDGQNQQQQMLSFSSPKSEQPLLVNKTSTFPYSPHPPLSSYNKNTGYNSGSMHGILTGTRGSFTPSQWMELEHQALIYKYITANVAVPSHLLIPIKKALDSAGLYNLSNGFIRPNAMGWGGFHLGYSNNTDPEPGRCRRTDGKKWRCSRDAVVDQKYCERHLNRGRHRSRKPVEGQSGHTVTTATATTTKSPINPTTTTVTDNNRTFAQQQHKKIVQFPLASDACAPPNRMIMNNKDIGSGGRIPEVDHALPMLPPKENPPFMIHKQQISYEESPRNDFGLVSCDSLLNPSHKGSTLISSRGLTNRETDSQNSLRQFIDDWPKTQSNHRSGFSWPELEMQSESTELSISISSPTNEKVTLSPLRLSREFDPIQMCLGVGNGNGNGNGMDESNSTRHTNWIPIEWEDSMGGPLGEALNRSNNNNNTNEHHCVRNSSALNLMTDGWDNCPTPIGSSPTGVLQKTSFGSLSNSSAGSSPRAENKIHEGASLCSLSK